MKRALICTLVLALFSSVGYRLVTAQAPAEPASQADPADAARRNKALVTFTGGQITVGDLEDAILNNNPMMQARYRLAGEREKLLEQLLRLELMSREAEAQGYGDSQAVRQAVMQNAVQILLREDFDDQKARQAISDAEIKAYYEANEREFKSPAMRRASYALFKTEQEAKAALGGAKTADLRAFRQLARDKSIDEKTKLRGGDLRYFEADGTVEGSDGEGAPEALAKAAFSLKTVGETYPDVIQLEQGFGVLKLTGIRQASERTLAQVSDAIRLRLWREKRQAGIDALIARLKTEHKPIVNAELIAEVELEDTTPIPRGPGLPKGFPQRETSQQQAGAEKQP